MVHISTLKGLEVHTLVPSESVRSSDSSVHASKEHLGYLCVLFYTFFCIYK